MRNVLPAQTSTLGKPECGRKSPHAIGVLCFERQSWTGDTGEVTPRPCPTLATPLQNPQIPQGCCSYLGVLGGDLQHKGQAVVVEVLIQSQQGPVHAALHQVVPVLAQPDGLDPVNHLVVGPHQHICTTARARLRATSHHTRGSEEGWGCPEAFSLCPRMILGLSFPAENREVKCHKQLSSLYQAQS